MGYRSHSVPFPGFEALKIVDIDLVDEVRTHPLSHDTPQIYQPNLHIYLYNNIYIYVLCIYLPYSSEIFSGRQPRQDVKVFRRFGI